MCADPISIQHTYNTTYIQQVKLRKEGADPTLVKDLLYWNNGSSFEKLTLNEWQRIVLGKAKL